jgi:hypothetical protein
MAETAVDHVIDVLGVCVPLRDFRVYNTAVKSHAFAWDCVSAALRRHWSLPHLDWTVDILVRRRHQSMPDSDGTYYIVEDDDVGAAVESLYYVVESLITSAYLATLGHSTWKWEHAALDKAVLLCAAKLESLPRDVMIAKHTPPICPVRWHGDIRIPSHSDIRFPSPCTHATSMELLAWRHNTVAEAAFLLGDDGHHPVVDDLSFALHAYTSPSESSTELRESAVRAVWNCVVTERVPQVTRSVATVLPVVALPELVAEYVIGSSAPSEPFRRIAEGSR